MRQREKIEGLGLGGEQVLVVNEEGKEKQQKRREYKAKERRKRKDTSVE